MNETLEKDEKLKLIFAQLDNLRNSGKKVNYIDFIKTLIEEGIKLKYDDIIYIIENFPLHRRHMVGEFYLPKFITSFINSYLKDSEVDSILDPWAVIGSIGQVLSERLKPSKTVALFKKHEHYELSNLLYKNNQIENIAGNPIRLVDGLEESFDLVVANLPWGMRPLALTLKNDLSEINIRDEEGNLLLLKSAMLLSKEGVGFFIVSPKFMFSNNDKSVRANLSKFGLYIEAALSLPSRTFPMTKLDGLLVIIRKSKSEKLFIGKLAADIKQNDILLKNLKLKIEGKALQLGTLVEQDSFKNYRLFVNNRELKLLAKRYGLEPKKLTIITEKINLCNKKLDDGFNDLPNSVYLPTIGKSDAVSFLSDLHIKPQNYVQLVLKHDEANANYFANLLNTPLGQKIRQTLLSGTYIPKINKSTLINSTVYLPDLNTQLEVVRVQSIIKDLSSELTFLEKELWKNPRKVNIIEKKTKSLNREDDFVDWMDSLPFPLASILWAYKAESNNEHKVEHLLHFFEAASQFNVIILLSYFYSDKLYFQEEKSQFIEKSDKFNEHFQKASFGGWNILGRRMAKTVRKNISDPMKRNRCIEAFGFPDNIFLEMIISKKFFEILDEISNYRNLWKGHSGISSDEETYKRLTILKDKLSDFRKLISDNYKKIKLILPITNVYVDDIYEYQVKSLMGTRTPFNKTEIKTLKPMTDNKLYLINTNQEYPIKLWPFIRFMKSPKTQENACYYYNRIQKSKVRWVSYHYDKDAETIIEDPELEKALLLLKYDDLLSPNGKKYKY